jgi:hypothetical protein
MREESAPPSSLNPSLRPTQTEVNIPAPGHDMREVPAPGHDMREIPASGHDMREEPA